MVFAALPITSLSASGESDRQVLAVYDEVEIRLKQAGVKPLYSEGSAGSGWMVFDYGELSPHFRP